MQLTIAAKQLAELAMDDVCERCVWRRYYVKKLPFDRVAGVFSSLDKAGKLAVDEWMKTGSPPWMSKFGAIQSLIQPPHWSKFYFEHGDLKVRGVADIIAVLPNGNLLIPDLKTATFTESQEKWVPLYAGQLGCYALAAEARGIGKVEQLALVYCQPRPEGQETDMKREEGYAVFFNALMLGVDRNDDRIYKMCERAQKILQGPQPSAHSECENCQLLAAIFDMEEAQRQAALQGEISQ